MLLLVLVAVAVTDRQDLLLDERDLLLLDLLLLERGLLDLLLLDLLLLDLLPPDLLPLDLLLPGDDDRLAVAEPLPEDFDEPLEDRVVAPPEDDFVAPFDDDLAEPEEPEEDDFVAPEDRCAEPLDFGDDPPDFCDEVPDFACGDDPLEPFDDPLDDPLPSWPPASRLTPPTTLVATPMPSRPTFFQSVRRLPTGSPRTVERLLSLRGLFIAASLRALRRPAVAGFGGGQKVPLRKTQKLGRTASEYVPPNAEYKEPPRRDGSRDASVEEVAAGAA